MMNGMRSENSSSFGRPAAGCSIPPRAEKPLYHVAGDLSRWKCAQRSIKNLPIILCILSIAFFRLIPYNNNCQGERTKMRFRYLPPTDQWCSPLGERDAVSTYRPVALYYRGFGICRLHEPAVSPIRQNNKKRGDKNEKTYV